ncbi:MAG TPA: EthD family reductase [Chloroflexota bacterium]|nr:EthD family reductase [Chloroflexota bacterium]
MYKFVTIYRKVDDEAKLEDFFSSTHLPLAESLPNLQRREVSRITRKPGGASRYYLMLELYFENEAAFQTAVVSETGVQLIQALKPWADAKIITWFFADSFTE